MSSINSGSKYSQYSYDHTLQQNKSQHDIPKRDMRQEMILYFYSSMLQYITEKKEIETEESVQSIPSAERILTSQGYEEFESIEEKESTLLWEEAEELQASFSVQNVVKIHSEFLKPRKKKSTVRRRQDRASKLIDLKLRASKRILNVPSQIKKKTSFAPTDYWVLDHKEEYVKIKFLNGNKYEGTTFCNMLHGQGKYTWANGTTYEGEFRNNEITGKGRYQFPDQTIYSGEVYKNYCHGSGLLFPSNSPCIYKGTFYLNTKQGFGWQLFSDNNTYEGEWFDDQMNGEGRRKFPSGAEYYGKFIMGKRHGYGVAVLKNHDVYAGEWVQGERDGFGDYIWNVHNEYYFAIPVHSSYYGSWVDNKRDGIGVINFGMVGGSRYAGYFSNNEKHGSGVIICENGHVIESNPLFINDKPVHVTDTGTLENLQPANSTVDLSINEEETPISSVSHLDFTNEMSREESLFRKFPLSGKLPFATSSVEEQSSIDMSTYFKQNKDNPDVYNKTFPKIMDQYSSLKIPIGVSSELIDLNSHIYKIIEYKSSITTSCQNKEINESGSFAKFISCSSSVETYSDYELHIFEERLIRKSISKYLSQLKRIYNLYAKIGCIEKNTTFKPWLMRIFFWQLYRDCKIPEKGLSLIDIDLMLSEKSTFDCYVVHNPFEIIYFWQYLESLLHVALVLYGDLFTCSDDGILKQSFEYLMDNDILPNAGHFTGSALFEYKDVIPINAVYAWYKSFGEPHSVKHLFNNIFKLGNKKNTGQNKEVLDLPYIRFGRNVIHCGKKIFYFEDDDDGFLNKPAKEKIKSMQYENPNKLYFLANLKLEQISKNIYLVCPSIKDNKDINDIEYKLSFLEFYEIILLCIQENVKMKDNISPCLSMISKPTPIKEKRLVSLGRKSKKAQG